MVNPLEVQFGDTMTKLNVTREQQRSLVAFNLSQNSEMKMKSNFITKVCAFV